MLGQIVPQFPENVQQLVKGLQLEPWRGIIRHFLHRRQGKNNQKIGAHHVQDKGIGHQRAQKENRAVFAVFMQKIGQRKETGNQRKKHHGLLNGAIISGQQNENYSLVSKILWK